MMNIKKFFLAFCFAFPVSFVFSQDVTIHLFAAFKLHTITINPTEYHYQLRVEGAEPVNLKRNHAYQVMVQGNKLKVKDRFGVVGIFDRFSLVPDARINDIRIDAPQMGIPARFYEGIIDIEIRDGQLFIINRLDIENYVAGVVEAESGIKADIEYYKAQAVICRTYILSHLDRHKGEGFNLCDDVHCQVYKGKPRLSTDIIEATLSTSGMVIIDNDKNLITAAFHSNCGGQTVNSEDVWSKSLPYLRTVNDTFCLLSKNARWTDSVSINKWRNYLRKPFRLPDSIPLDSSLLNFVQPIRSSFLISGKDTLPLKSVRSDFKLRSTFFSFQPRDTFIIFTGRGYGHGVGLCQEGAMRMAEKGYTYSEIIKYYYTGVSIVHITQVPQNSQ